MSGRQSTGASVALLLWRIRGEVLHRNGSHPQEVDVTALMLAIVSGVILLAVVIRTLLITIRDDRGRTPTYSIYDTRRPSP